MNSGSSTSLSLLMLLQQGSNQDAQQQSAAWEEFVRMYGSNIYKWCLNRKLSPPDAEDVCQIVLIKVAKGIQKFQYNPAGSFRGWLRRVTENAIHDYFREQQRQSPAAAVDPHAQLHSAESREDLVARMEAAFDLELLEKAIESVRKRVSATRFLAWELAAKEGLNAADIASQLDMNIATVYTTKCRVQKQLQEEIERLEGDLNLGIFKK